MTDRATAAITQFMRTLSRAAADLADVLERPAAHRPGRIEDLGLGTLQVAVAQVLATAEPATGISPREVAHALDRGDEPNVRTALNRLGDRGVAELVPDLPTQHWRLTCLYREANEDD
jgi:hypothetical protein